MKKMIIVMVLLSLGLTSFGLEFDGLNTGVAGKYVWRGITFNNEGVQQGDTGFSVGNISFNIWWNQDLADELTNAGDISEVDYTIGYSTSISDTLALDIGYILYTFPEAEDQAVVNTSEIYVGFSCDNYSFTIYKDIDLAEGTYITLGYSNEFTLKKDAPSIAFDITLGYTDASNAEFHHAGLEEGGFSDLTVSLSTSIALSDKISLEPYIAWSELLGDFATAGTRDVDDNNRAVWAGFNLAFSL